MFDTRGRVTTRQEYLDLVQKLSHGEYFLVQHLRMNLKFEIFEKLLNGIIKEIKITSLKPELPMYDNNAISMDTLDLKRRNFQN